MDNNILERTSGVNIIAIGGSKILLSGIIIHKD